MKYRIIGDTVQTVAVELTEGESVFSRIGTLLFVKGAVNSETGPKGGYWSNITSTLKTRGEAPLVVYRCEKGGGLLGFRSPGPGKIHVVYLDGTARVTAKRTSLLSASEGVAIDPVHMDGEDSDEIPSQHFVTLAGSGWAFLHGPGNLLDFTINTGEQMVVDGSMILAMDGELTYAPRPTGKMSSGSTSPYVFLMHIAGPGRVILHTVADS